MSDEQENVGAGSETSGEQAADTTAPEQSETAATDTAETTASETAQAEQETAADSAGGAADAVEDSSETSGEAANSDESRTGFVSGARAGDQCICPDGRKGTVHKFDEGLVCIPNHDQG